MASINAASTSRADVNTAIAASSNGDTVVIPSGSSTWTSTITFSKDINIVGNGIGSTIIERDFTAPLLDWTVGSGGFELSHITFDGGDLAASNGLIRVTGSAAGTANRIHHCKFLQYDTRGLYIDINNKDWWGVVDNCNFQTSLDPQDISIFGGDAGNDSDPWKYWNSALGTEYFWFIEDNDFNHTVTATDTAVDLFRGAKAVIRYNTTHGVNIGWHGTDSGESISPLAVEVYENDLQNGVQTNIYRGIQSRGGTGVCYNNTFGTAYQNLHLNSNRSNESYRSTAGNWGIIDGNNSDNIIPDGNETPDGGSGDGSHSGSNGSSVLTDSRQSWTTNEWSSPYQWFIRNITDGSGGFIVSNTSNTVTVTLSGGTDNDWDSGDVYEITNGYPGLGQVGMGSAGTGSLTGMVHQPFVSWNNTKNSASFEFVVDADTQRESDQVLSNRDFINGTSSADVADADPTQSDNVPYVAYDYPHPLRDLSGPPVLSPLSAAILI